MGLCVCVVEKEMNRNWESDVSTVNIHQYNEHKLNGMCHTNCESVSLQSG